MTEILKKAQDSVLERKLRKGKLVDMYRLGKPPVRVTLQLSDDGRELVVIREKSKRHICIMLRTVHELRVGQKTAVCSV